MVRTVKPTVETTILVDLIEELCAEAEAAAAAKAANRPRGPQTGLAMLDEALGSFLAPGVHLLQAPPGAGKTAFALQLAALCAYPALFISCEMPRIELFRRVISRTTNTFLGKLKDGSLAADIIRQRAMTAAQKVPHLAIVDATRAYAHPFEDILPTARALRQRFEAESVLIVIDSLQVWARFGASDAAEYDRVNAAQAAASAIASELNCPLVAVSHMNRAGNRAQSSRDGSGGLHAGKGSGDLEYAAETVLELKPRDKTGDVRQVDLSIHKNRHGESGLEIPLHFEGRVQRFNEA